MSYVTTIAVTSTIATTTTASTAAAASVNTHSSNHYHNDVNTVSNTVTNIDNNNNIGVNVNNDIGNAADIEYAAAVNVDVDVVLQESIATQQRDIDNGRIHHLLQLQLQVSQSPLPPQQSRRKLPVDSKPRSFTSSIFGAIKLSKVIVPANAPPPNRRNTIEKYQENKFVAIDGSSNNSNTNHSNR
eukprot:gene9134-18923_t